MLAVTFAIFVISGNSYQSLNCVNIPLTLCGRFLFSPLIACSMCDCCFPTISWHFCIDSFCSFSHELVSRDFFRWYEHSHCWKVFLLHKIFAVKSIRLQKGKIDGETNPVNVPVCLLKSNVNIAYPKWSLDEICNFEINWSIIKSELSRLSKNN